MKSYSAQNIRRGDRGFTLVEMTTSVGLLLIVMSAAWMLLTTSGDNLNRIQFGSDASEANRMAIDLLGRDVARGVVLTDGNSPVIIAEPRRFGIVANADHDPAVELVVWQADDENHELLRIVTESTPTTPSPVSEADFAGGAVSQRTIAEGVATADAMPEPMFSYFKGAATPASGINDIGLVRVRLRNGAPNPDSNVTDRSAAFRVIAYVINGY